MKKFIPLSVPNIKGNEIEYVTDALQKEWVSTGGEYINKFENDIAKYLNVSNATACQSGTAGLHLSLLVADVKNNDEVLVPTLTFIAAVNPVKYVGAEPVFMDCDDSLTIDVDKTERFCEEECEFKDNKLINKRTGRHIKALIVVHVFGNMADMPRIMKLAQRFNLKVIEDATEALGSRYTDGEFKGRFAGTIGDFGVYSFNGNKIITTGGGGIVLCKNEENALRVKHLSTQAKSDELFYTHDEIGYNYRMTNVQAAMGVGQLERLEDFIKTKEKNYNKYCLGIEKIKGLGLFKYRKLTRPNYWFYGLIIDKDYPINRDELIKIMQQERIQTRPIWGLIHEQIPYRNSQTYKIEKASKYINSVINIPCSSNLSEDDIDVVLNTLNNIYDMRE